MTLLFFKTDSTGLINSQAPPDDPSQPHLLAIAGSLTTDSRELGALACLVNPMPNPQQAPEFNIPEDVARYNGITPAMAIQGGLPVRTVLNLFNHLAFRASHAIAFNFDFHDRILETAALRTGTARVPIKERMIDLQKLCGEAMGRSGKVSLADAYAYFMGKPLEKRPFRLNDIYAMRHIWEAIAAKYPGLLPQER